MNASNQATSRLPQNSTPWELLSEMLPTADWTAEPSRNWVATNIDPRSQDEDIEDDTISDTRNSDRNILDEIARALYRRRKRHVLITGFSGIGKTETVRELAKRAAASEIPFLKDCRFLWIDVSNVGLEDSRACLETIAAAADQPPSSPITVDESENLGDAIGRIFQTAWERTMNQEAGKREHVVLVLDGIDTILRRPNGGTNKPLLRAIASRPGVQIIGIIDRWAFNDLIAGDAKMLELFTRIDIEEPPEETAHAVLQQKASEFEREYDLAIGDEVVEKTISLASNYVLNENHPAKGIRILELACDEVLYETTQLENVRREVNVADIVRVVSGLTGIPEVTLYGKSGETNFEQALAEVVVGQDRAVCAAATELRLIKSGLSEPGKPASVLLFAGMTGVGKTELAKRIAELYSTSKRLTTYAMGNFTEPHSVSGIIGVPPGYVGHEEGGRLINELNSDPYSVFLLDEAEKCHPNVWKPFLNLFDEGWIVDQRGQKAYADRAIFILTTNAGDKVIAQMARQGKHEVEIIERVKATLSRVRHERSTQSVFAPQFLSRMKRIVVFDPLNEDAMVGVARKQVDRTAVLWRQKRDKSLNVADDAIVAIGRRAHALNEKANGEEGGRIVRKLISDLIENEVQIQATRNDSGYQGSREILVAVESGDEPLEDQNPRLAVAFH